MAGSGWASRLWLGSWGDRLQEAPSSLPRQSWCGAVGRGCSAREGSGAELEGHSVTAVTHACDRNALLALSLCPGSCPATRGGPAGPCTPAAAQPWHPQPRVPCGSTPAPPAPLLQRGLMPPLPKLRNPPSPPAALKHAVFCPGAQDLPPAPLCSPSSHALPCSLRASRSSHVPGGARAALGSPGAAGSSESSRSRAPHRLSSRLAARGVYTQVGAAERLPEPPAPRGSWHGEG